MTNREVLLAVGYHERKPGIWVKGSEDPCPPPTPPPIYSQVEPIPFPEVGEPDSVFFVSFGDLKLPNHRAEIPDFIVEFVEHSAEYLLTKLFKVRSRLKTILNRGKKT
jgi:hypothetical protein